MKAVNKNGKKVFEKNVLAISSSKRNKIYTQHSSYFKYNITIYIPNGNNNNENESSVKSV